MISLGETSMVLCIRRDAEKCLRDLCKLLHTDVISRYGKRGKWIIKGVSNQVFKFIYRYDSWKQLSTFFPSPPQLSTFWLIPPLSYLSGNCRPLRKKEINPPKYWVGQIFIRKARTNFLTNPITTQFWSDNKFWFSSVIQLGAWYFSLGLPLLFSLLLTIWQLRNFTKITHSALADTTVTKTEYNTAPFPKGTSISLTRCQKQSKRSQNTKDEGIWKSLRGQQTI